MNLSSAEESASAVRYEGAAMRENNQPLNAGEPSHFAGFIFREAYLKGCSGGSWRSGSGAQR